MRELSGALNYKEVVQPTALLVRGAMGLDLNVERLATISVREDIGPRPAFREPAIGEDVCALAPPRQACPPAVWSACPPVAQTRFRLRSAARRSTLPWAPDSYWRPFAAPYLRAALKNASKFSTGVCSVIESLVPRM